jgi:hypothetical protein
MSRGLSAAFKEALGQSVVYPSLFVQFEFAETTTRFWTGESSIIWNTHTFTGGGMLGHVKTSGEGSEIMSRNLIFSLNGVDQSYYSLALTAEYQNRPVKLWFNLVNSDSTAVVYSYLLEEGRMDVLTINESDDSISLTLECESSMVDLFNPRRYFLNDEVNRKIHPTDYFYRWVPVLNTIALPWGMKAVSMVNSSTSVRLGESRRDSIP